MSKFIVNGMEEVFNNVTEAVKSELEYAYKKWEENRAVDNPQLNPDSEKSLQDWIGWAKLELETAERELYQLPKGIDGSTKDATDHIRKAAGHLFRGMMYYGVIRK